MPSSKVKFTIIITCYNYEFYIAQAIDSVLGQTRQADEFIVINDGSTDTSKDIIDGYGEKLRAIHQQNVGFKATCNRGFAEATGDIIVFLDADDRLCADALASVEAIWQPSFSKVQFDLDIIDGEGLFLGRRFCNFVKDIPPALTQSEFSKLGTYIWPVMSGNAYARSFLEKVMPLTPPVGHDGVWNTIAPLYGEVATIGRPLGQYRIHARNMSLTQHSGGKGPYPDFSRSIRIRDEEFAILREHAEKLGVELPRGNLMDNELIFVNYRLMAWRLGLDYINKAADTSIGLLCRGLWLTIRRDASLRSRIANAGWLCALTLAPQPVARSLVTLRFNRAQFKRRLGLFLRRSGTS